VEFTEAATRRNFVPDAQIVEQVFQMPAPEEGAVELAVVESSDGYAVVELQSVADGELGATTPGELQFRRQIANAAASAEWRGFMQQLRESARVKVFEERLR
jgi:hypothetical protein